MLEHAVMHNDEAEADRLRAQIKRGGTGRRQKLQIGAESRRGALDDLDSAVDAAAGDADAKHLLDALGVERVPADEVVLKPYLMAHAVEQ